VEAILRNEITLNPDIGISEAIKADLNIKWKFYKARFLYDCST
jgi:hypothetical protein